MSSVWGSADGGSSGFAKWLPVLAPQVDRQRKFRQIALYAAVRGKLGKIVCRGDDKDFLGLFLHPCQKEPNRRRLKPPSESLLVLPQRFSISSIQRTVGAIDSAREIA